MSPFLTCENMLLAAARLIPREEDTTWQGAALSPGKWEGEPPALGMASYVLPKPCICCFLGE